MARYGLVVLVGCSISFGCSSPDPERSDDGSEEAIGESALPVVCPPHLDRYPVGGPHNGGYDSNALNYTCPPHPGDSPDNSDFIGGQHYGNDLFGQKGTPVVASVSGTIVNAGFITIGGNRVTVQDGCGWNYYSAHLDTIAVSVGQNVNAGDVIGTLGNTGDAQFTSPHVHFSIFPESYEAGIDPFSLLQGVDGTACGCKPHCDGSKIFGSDCGSGDCGVYGATCVDDAIGVRCASVFCPATGQKKVCVNQQLIGDCNDGALSTGDCSAYGSLCIDDAKGPRCVVVFCADKPTTVHDVCLPDGTLGHCDDAGGLTVEKCSASAPCTSDADGAQCGSSGSSSSGGTGGSGAGGGGWNTGGTISASGGSGGHTTAAGTGAVSGRKPGSPAAPDGDAGAGCGCRTAPEQRESPWVLALLGIGIYVARRQLDLH